MARGSRFSMVLNWFRTGDADEVQAILPLVIEAVGKRHITISTRAGSVRVPVASTAKVDRSASARRANATDTAAINHMEASA